MDSSYRLARLETSMGGSSSLQNLQNFSGLSPLPHVHALPFSQAGTMHLSWARTDLLRFFLLSIFATHFVVWGQENPTVIVLGVAHGLFEVLFGGLHREALFPLQKTTWISVRGSV